MVCLTYRLQLKNSKSYMKNPLKSMAVWKWGWWFLVPSTATRISMTGLRKGGWTLIGPTWPVAPPVQLSFINTLFCCTIEKNGLCCYYFGCRTQKIVKVFSIAIILRLNPVESPCHTSPHVEIIGFGYPYLPAMLVLRLQFRKLL